MTRARPRLLAVGHRTPPAVTTMRPTRLASALVALWAMLAASPAPAEAAAGGAAGAGFCRDCPAPDCGDAAARAARLRRRIDELRTSEQVIARRADDARGQASQAYSGMTRPGGSAGRFSQEFGGMADVRESLASGAGDSLEDLVYAIEDVSHAGAAASAVRQATGAVRADVVKTRDLMTTAERYDAQANDIRNARDDLEQQLADLLRECGAAAGGGAPAPSRAPEGSPGAPRGGGGGGGGGGSNEGRGNGPPRAGAVPPARDLDQVLGYLVKLEPATRRLVDLTASTLPALEAIAKSAEGTGDPERRAAILAGAAPHLAEMRSRVDEAVALGRDALAVLSGGRR